jgi:hypothetical protein
MHDWHNEVRTNSFKNEAELIKHNTKQLKANQSSTYYVKMSFGYAVGDVIAILGLFERIAIELRNYKDAPMHFQRLCAELDLVRSTLKHVLMLEPESPAERQRLEKVRAIIMHCGQPLQSMAEKMRAKESSLGHFKTTRSLSSIGTRLHWSMIAQGDVEELRKTIMSQMAAIKYPPERPADVSFTLPTDRC